MCGTDSPLPVLGSFPTYATKSRVACKEEEKECVHCSAQREGRGRGGGGQWREEGPRREERYRGEEGKHGNAMCVCMRTYSFPARSKRHSVERVLA